jgi:NAD(P)-dependent dehydrogenase (short-subunit alcohol dehydrogenase family)
MRLAAAKMMTADPTPDGERGVIINVASIAAFDGQQAQTAYAAAKAGVVGLTLPAARDLREQQIRVMTIAPGSFDTPPVQGLPQQVRDMFTTAAITPGRLGYPAEFGDLVRHICENPYLNGETIRIDGGARLPMT